MHGWVRKLTHQCFDPFNRKERNVSSLQYYYHHKWDGGQAHDDAIVLYIILYYGLALSAFDEQICTNKYLPTAGNKIDYIEFEHWSDGIFPFNLLLRVHTVWVTAAGGKMLSLISLSLPLSASPLPPFRSPSNNHLCIALAQILFLRDAIVGYAYAVVCVWMSCCRQTDRKTIGSRVVQYT